MYKIVALVLLSFFPLSKANDLAKIEDLKKRFAEYRQEHEKAITENKKAEVIACVSIGMPLALGLAMEAGLRESSLMQQRINDLPLSLWTSIACMTISTGIFIYAAFKIDAAYQQYQNAKEMAKEIEKALAFSPLNQKST